MTIREIIISMLKDGWQPNIPDIRDLEAKYVRSFHWNYVTRIAREYRRQEMA